MNNRISLFSFKTGHSIEAITQAFLKKRYTPESSSGFMLNKSDSHVVRGKHISVVKAERRIVTPFGDTETEVMTDYLVNEFEIVAGLIKIKNATKSLVGFKNDLAKALEYDCMIAFPRLDLNLLAEKLSKESDIVVTGIDVHSYNLFPKTISTLSLKGNEGIIDHVRYFLGDKEYIIKKLHVSMRDKGELEISYKGNVKTLDPNLDNTLYKRVVLNFVEKQLLS